MTTTSLPPEAEGIHDLGGRPAGPIDTTDREPSLFDKRVDAMFVLLFGPDQAVFSSDAHRRAYESIGAEAYGRLTYYQRWLEGLRIMLVERGVLTDAEIDRRVAALEAGVGEEGP